jgi:CTP:molybdopterin cytidylyltransferase MocA
LWPSRHFGALASLEGDVGGRALLERLAGQVRAVPIAHPGRRGYPLLTPRDARSPIVAVVAENAERLAPTLRAAQVNVTARWNHVRAAVSVFNDMDDVERLIAGLPRV